MKKKTRIILLSVVIPALMAASIIYYHINRTTDIDIVPQADWVDHYSDVDSLIEAADIIIKGKVVGSTTEQRVDMIFTNQEIEVKKVYQGDVKEGDTITLLQTGGEMNGIVTQAFEEAPLLDKNGNYLLFLKYTDEGHYLVLGGYQGVGKINNNALKFVVKSDEIATELAGESLTDVESLLTEKTEHASDDD